MADIRSQISEGSPGLARQHPTAIQRF
jgi:hypothetical protein